MADAPLAREQAAVALPPGWRANVLAEGLARVAAAQRPAAVAVPGSAHGGVRQTLRLEGAAVLALAVVAYAQTGAGWLPFALFFFAPDLSLLGYFGGARVGAALYNAAHSTLGPLLVIGVGALGDAPVALAFGLIWLAHVGFDRLCGFGLKYASGFGHTHLGLIGRPDPW